MPTLVHCPACGASDPGPSEGVGPHSCQYCGARYRMDSSGHARAVAVAGSSGSRPAAIAAAAAALLAVLGGAVAVYLMQPVGDPDRPTPTYGVQYTPPEEAPPTAAPLRGTSVAVALATPTPAPVASATFTEHSRRTASDGSLWILGMMRNTSTFALDTTEVIAVLQDAQGREISTHNAFSTRDVLAPSEDSPVQILVQKPPAFASIEYEIDADVPSYLPRQVEGLRVETKGPKKAMFGLEIEGKVFHDGTVPAKFVELEILAWDAEDRLVGLGTTYAKGDVLQPGANARWKEMSLSTAREPARFEVFVTGRPAD